MAFLLLAALLVQGSDLRQLLSGDDAAARRRGIEAIAKLKGTERDEAIKTAGEVLEQKKADIDKAIETLRSLVDPKTVKKPLDEWNKQQEKAFSAVFNTGSFPDPRPTDKVKGPFKGFDRVDAAMKKLDAAYAEVEKIIDAIQALKLSEYGKKLDAATEAIKELEAALGKGGAAPKPWSDPFWDAAAKFDAGDLAAGVEGAKANSLTSLQRQILFFLYCRAFIKAELAADNGMDEKEREGVKLINLLRMRLGVLPMEGDARLATSIELHLQDMEKNGYFGHMEKAEATKAPYQRCKLQGYGAVTGENLASTPEPDKSIELWRWDGGHFRNMVNPGFVQIGLGISKGACGFNVGAGDGVKRPRLER